MARQELCITLSPATAVPERVVERIERSFLGRSFADLPVTLDRGYLKPTHDREFLDGYADRHPERSAPLAAFRTRVEAGRGYLYGTVSDFNVCWGVAEAFLEWYDGDGRVLVVYTESESDSGVGLLFERDGDGWVERDEFTEQLEGEEGAYGTALQSYFASEHGLFARRYTFGALDPLPE